MAGVGTVPSLSERGEAKHQATDRRDIGGGKIHLFISIEGVLQDSGVKKAQKKKKERKNKSTAVAYREKRGLGLPLFHPS